MSAVLPTDPGERDVLAGEYVLGTLDARMAAAVAAALEADLALREAVQAWEIRLAPLSALATPEAPPPDLWARIEARFAPAPARSPAAGRISWLWRGWAIGATLAAAGFAGLALLPRAPQTRYMTVLVTDRSQPAWLAQADAKGGLRISTVASLDGTRPTTPEGRVLPRAMPVRPASDCCRVSRGGS
jgi:anti-sigma-K factor RskA